MPSLILRKLGDELFLDVPIYAAVDTAVVMSVTFTPITTVICEPGIHDAR